MKKFLLILNCLLTSIATLSSEELVRTYGKLTVSVNPPAIFTRVDDTDTDLAQIIKAGVPDSNYLLAAYVDKNSLLGRRGGEESGLFPYFLIQTSKAAANQGGITGGSMAAIIEQTAKSGGAAILKIDRTSLEDLRVRITKAAQMRLGERSEIQQPQVQVAGTVAKSDKHVTIMAYGRTGLQTKEGVIFTDVVATLTVLDIDGMPVFIYLYEKDDSTSASITRAIELTSQIVANVKGK